MTTKRTNVLLAASLLLAVGCGGGGTDAWVGMWIADVTEAESCQTGDYTTPLKGAFPITAGSASDEVVTTSGNGCVLDWIVSGADATLTPNQVCSVPGSAGGTWTPTFATGSLSLSGNVITVGDQGTATLVFGTTQQCTFTQSGTFTKS